MRKGWNLSLRRWMRRLLKEINHDIKFINPNCRALPVRADGLRVSGQGEESRLLHLRQSRGGPARRPADGQDRTAPRQRRRGRRKGFGEGDAGRQDGREVGRTEIALRSPGW